VIKRYLCDFINNKRLIYVKNISPKAAIFSFRYVVETPCSLPLRVVRVATQVRLVERRGGENESLWRHACSGILLSRPGYSIVLP
jgi:hypothetical protein